MNMSMTKKQIVEKLVSMAELQDKSEKQIAIINERSMKKHKYWLDYAYEHFCDTKANARYALHVATGILIK